MRSTIRRSGKTHHLAAVLALGVGVAGTGYAVQSQRLVDVPPDHWARPAIEVSVRKGLMDAPEGKFQPDKVVTRAELAVVLVRLIDAVEKAGPKPFNRSPAGHIVPPEQLEFLKGLPPKHRGTPALVRLVKGGYLSPPNAEKAWLPRASALDRPAPAEEVAIASASVLVRMEEKKVAVERPESLKEGIRPENP